jgi:hypothetical protein
MSWSNTLSFKRRIIPINTLKGGERLRTNVIHPLKLLKRLNLGIALANKIQEEIDWKRMIVQHEKHMGLLTEKAGGAKLQHLNKRCISAGDDLWRSSKKKIA